MKHSHSLIGPKRAVRRFLFAGLALFLGAGARAAMPAPLEAALKRAAEEFERWAYTETTVIRDRTGKARKGETIVRVDPSKPYEEQFTPLKIAGKEPTEKQRAKYRQRGIEHGKQLEQETAKVASGVENPLSINIGDRRATVDFANARLVNEAGSLLTYELPLRPEGDNRLPVEKFQLVMRVDRDRQSIEHAGLRLVAPLRVMMVAKVERGEMTASFTPVDPKLPSVLSVVRMDYSASALFVKKADIFEATRADFQRVKPYSEKFGVKIGPLRALPF
jgi:hypothetical protein